MAFNGMHSKDPPFNGKQSPKIKREYGEGEGEGNGFGVYVPQHPKIKNEYGNGGWKWNAWVCPTAPKAQE